MQPLKRGARPGGGQRPNLCWRMVIGRGRRGRFEHWAVRVGRSRDMESPDWPDGGLCKGDALSVGRVRRGGMRRVATKPYD